MGDGREKLGPLDGHKVIDVTADRGMFAGKLLHDMGAEVIRIEPPDSVRGDSDYVYLNAGKRRVTIDPDDAENTLTLNQLLKDADVFLEDHMPGKVAERGLGYDDLKAVNPGIIYVSITDFGQGGERPEREVTEVEIQGLSGWLSVTGETENPVALPGNLTWHTACLFAVNGVLLALYNRHTTGAGQYLDVSIQECGAAVLDHVLVRQAYTGDTAVRQGSLHWNNMFRVFPCKDGYILLSIHRQWETLAEWIASEGMAGDLADERYRDEVFRNGNIRHIITIMERWTLSHTVGELEETGQLMRFPWARVVAIPELLTDEHLGERGFFQDIHTPGGTFKVPGAPVRMSDSPWRSGDNLRPPENDTPGRGEDEGPEWSGDG